MKNFKIDKVKVLKTVLICLTEVFHASFITFLSCEGDVSNYWSSQLITFFIKQLIDLYINLLNLLNFTFSDKCTSLNHQFDKISIFVPKTNASNLSFLFSKLTNSITDIIIIVESWLDLLSHELINCQSLWISFYLLFVLFPELLRYRHLHSVIRRCNILNVPFLFF